MIYIFLLTEVDDTDLKPPEAELDEHHPKATRTLFIGNLEKDITIDELKEKLKTYGEIIVRMILLLLEIFYRKAIVYLNCVYQSHSSR